MNPHAIVYFSVLATCWVVGAGVSRALKIMDKRLLGWNYDDWWLATFIGGLAWPIALPGFAALGIGGVIGRRMKRRAELRALAEAEVQKAIEEMEKDEQELRPKCGSRWWDKFQK